MPRTTRITRIVLAGCLTLLVALAAAPNEAAAQDNPRNARFIFQLVEANGFEDTDPEIQDVVSELRELFRFDGYRLVDTALLNTSTIGGGGHARMGGGDHGPFQIETWVERTDDPNLLRVAVGLHSDEDGTPMEATVNVRDEQTLVLGSTRTMSGAALILIMRLTIS